MGHGEQPRAALIAFGDGDTEELLVTPVGRNLYRLEESSLLGEVQYHDVIETETLPDGGLRLVRVAAPSGLKAASWVVPENVFESPVLKGLLDRVMAVGGNWERTFGGVLTLHLPPVEEASIVHDVKGFFSTLPGQPGVVPGGEPQ